MSLMSEFYSKTLNIGGHVSAFFCIIFVSSTKKLSQISNKKIMNTNSPKFLSEFFTVSAHSERFIVPKFNLEYFKSKSFVYNGSKILNYLQQQDIPFTGISNPVFKSRVKRHLLTIQSQSVAGDSSWLPCNHNIFSDVKL